MNENEEREGTPERVIEAADAYARSLRDHGVCAVSAAKRDALKAEVMALDRDVRGRVLAEAVEHVAAAPFQSSDPKEER